MGIDRAELARRGIYDPDAPGAEEVVALAELLIERGATLDQLERGGNNLGAVSADLSLRGTGPRFTLAEAAEQQGVDLVTAKRAWRALGFSEPATDDAALNQAEASLLSFFSALSVLEPEAALQLIRVVGSSVARIAEATVAALRLSFEMPLRSSGAPHVDVSLAYKEMADGLLPQAVGAIDVILRRNIVAASLRNWDIDAERASTTAQLTVGFADMVGYTALSRSLATRDLIAAIGTFEREVVDLVTDHGGRVVKLIGDEVMFVTGDPVEACGLALALSDRFAADPVVPPLRVGLATGEVLTRDGDYYGRVVNAASRLVELAEPGGVVVSERVDRAVGDAFITDRLPPTSVKGYDEPVQAFRLRERRRRSR